MSKRYVFLFIGLSGVFSSPFLFDLLTERILSFGSAWAAAKVSRANHLSFWLLSLFWAGYFGFWIWKSDWSWLSTGDLKRKFYLVLVAATLARVALITITDAPPGADAKDYDRLAQNLAQTGRYEENGQPTAFRPVGYPAFLAGVYEVFGRNPVLPKLANVLFNLFSLILLWPLFSNWKNESSALKAITITAFYPPTLYTVQNLFAEHLFGFLWIGSIYAWGKNSRRQAFPLLSGLSFGLAALVRPVVLVWGLVPAASTLFGKRRPALIGFFLAATLATAPWFYRNYQKFGIWTLSTHSGLNLWMGANPQATGSYDLPDSLPFNLSDEAETERTGRRLGWQFIRENPGQFLKLGLVKEAVTFGFDYATILTTLEQKPVYSQLLWGIAGQAGWWVLLFFAANKITRLVFQREKWQSMGSFIPLGTIAVWVFIHFIFVGADRFHHPLVPFFAYLAVLPLSRKAETDRLQVAEGDRPPVQN